MEQYIINKLLDGDIQEIGFDIDKYEFSEYIKNMFPLEEQQYMTYFVTYIINSYYGGNNEDYEYDDSYYSIDISKITDVDEKSKYVKREVENDKDIRIYLSYVVGIDNVITGIAIDIDIDTLYTTLIKLINYGIELTDETGQSLVQMLDENLDME